MVKCCYFRHCEAQIKEVLIFLTSPTVMAVLIETSLGDVVIDLYTKERPKTCLNFLKLCKVKYYNFCLFHNVQINFIAQTGDPSGTGEGGSSIWGVIDGDEMKYFEAEIIPRLKHKKLGTVSMVNDGNNMLSSQFFLTLREDLDYLDGKHTVFGEVAEGLDVLKEINATHVDKNGRPLQDIRIFHTVVLDDPFDDPTRLEIPSRSPSPPPNLADTDHIGVDENIDEFEGHTANEIQELIEEREGKANAHILEMVGDIPDADGKPPENVLFVCKLNPVTTEEDLEIIFSRFGPIASCEVIRDKKTGDSLQYAFIEFENEEDCVKAYFKMDNVLIDDRRIHVDFSQSLATVKHTRKRLVSENDEKDRKMPAKSNTQTEGDHKDYELVFDESELTRKNDRKGPSETKRREGHRHDRSRERRRSYSRSPTRKKAHNSSKREKRSHHRSRSRSRERHHRKH